MHAPPVFSAASGEYRGGFEGPLYTYIDVLPHLPQFGICTSATHRTGCVAGAHSLNWFEAPAEVTQGPRRCHPKLNVQTRDEGNPSAMWLCRWVPRSQCFGRRRPKRLYNAPIVPGQLLCNSNSSDCSSCGTLDASRRVSHRSHTTHHWRLVPQRTKKGKNTITWQYLKQYLFR